MALPFASEAPIGGVSQNSRSADKNSAHSLFETSVNKVKSFVSRIEPGIAASIRTEHFFTKFNLFGSGYFRTGTEDRYFKAQFKRETLGLRLEKLENEWESHPSDAQLRQKINATRQTLQKAENSLENPDRIHLTNEKPIAIDAINLAQLYEELKGTQDKTTREEIEGDIRAYIAKAASRKTQYDFPPDRAS